MALPARGAPALGLKADQARFNKKYPKKPPKPPRMPKPPSMDEVANRNAMTTFRTALAQLQASQAPVDSNAIYAPYRQSQQVVGQLGQGLQTAVQGAGQAAQTQYAQGRDVAQQHAAQFGISAGAGANPTALQDTGTPALAAQTNAYAAAAPQAATAWQQLLERSAAAKVSDANLARTNVLNQGQASLATNLPSLIGDEKTKLFQQQTQRENMGLARTQLNVKQKNDLRDYLLGVAKVQTSASSAAENARIKREALAQKSSTDKAKLAQGAQKIAQGDKALTLKQQQAQKKAKAAGIRGISALNSALKTTTTQGKKPITGYKVTFLADPDGIAAGGQPVTLTVKDPNAAHPPAGYIKPKDSAPQAVYGQAGAGSSSSLTLARWNQLFSQFKAANRGLGFSDSVLRASMPPRPKTKN